jgi:hypothetical protein
VLRERARRGGAIGLALAAVMVVLVALGTATPSSAAVLKPQVFVPVGAGVYQTYVVPDGVYSLQVILRGGQGGPGGGGNTWGAGGAGGLGAEVDLSVAVTPGETLTVLVGAQGSPPASPFEMPAGGGGGGAMSVISRGGTPLAIAGGGGGGGGGGATELYNVVGNTAGGRGGDSGHDGYKSYPGGSGNGGFTGPLQWGGAAGSCEYPTDPNIDTCATPGGPGVGTSGGAGGAGERESLPQKDDPCSGSAGGDGGQGALGGGGGGGGGCDGAFSLIGVGGGGAGGTSSHFGNAGLILAGANSGDGLVIVTPLQGSAPPGIGQPPGPEPTTTAPPESVAHIEEATPVAAPVTVVPQLTG